MMNRNWFLIASSFFMVSQTVAGDSLCPSNPQPFNPVGKTVEIVTERLGNPAYLLLSADGESTASYYTTDSGMLQIHYRASICIRTEYVLKICTGVMDDDLKFDP